jgi:tetratricopeptide (TPR) repeat protein
MVLEFQTKNATLLQGLVAFAKEDYETAEKHWNLLAELDKEFYAQQKAAGWENATTLARLTWNLRNQKGSLYAMPEEMASFKDPKRRMAILIADLYYESEQHQKALSIYQRLENRELGTLSKNELAYVTLGVFICLCWDQSIDEIAYLLPRKKIFSDTPTFLRVIQYMANRLVASDNPTNQINAIKLYMKYIEHSNNTSEKAFFEDIIGTTSMHIKRLMYESNQQNMTAIWHKIASDHFRKSLEISLEYIEEIKDCMKKSNMY